MKVAKGKTYYVGNKKFKEGDELPAQFLNEQPVKADKVAPAKPAKISNKAVKSVDVSIKGKDNAKPKAS